MTNVKAQHQHINIVSLFNRNHGLKTNIQMYGQYRETLLEGQHKLGYSHILCKTKHNDRTQDKGHRHCGSER